jgi:hypothetical protein
MQVQLDFFKTEDELIEERLLRIEGSVNKTRKALFSRHGELARQYVDLSYRMQIIEQYICKGGVWGKN